MNHLNLTPEDQYSTSTQDLTDLVKESGVLNEIQANELVAILLRNGDLHPQRIIESLPALYNFESIESFIKSTAIIYKCSLTWSKPKSKLKYFMSVFRKSATDQESSIQDRTLTSLASDLNFRNNLKLFREFDSKSQKAIAATATFLSSSEIYVLMTVMKRTGLYIPDFVESGGIDDHRILQNHLQNLIIDGNPSEKVNVEITSERLWFLMYCEPRNHIDIRDFFRQGWFRISLTLTLLSSVYGQTMVIDAIDHLKLAKKSVTPDILMDILDDWQECKSYPAEWLLGIKY